MKILEIKKRNYRKIPRYIRKKSEKNVSASVPKDQNPDLTCPYSLYSPTLTWQARPGRGWFTNHHHHHQETTSDPGQSNSSSSYLISLHLLHARKKKKKVRAPNEDGHWESLTLPIWSSFYFIFPPWTMTGGQTSLSLPMNSKVQLIPLD